MPCRHVTAGARPYARGLCHTCYRHRGSVAEALAATCPGCPECAGWRPIPPIAMGAAAVPVPSYCACGRLKAASAPLCHRCAGLAWHADHPVPVPWSAPGELSSAARAALLRYLAGGC